MVSWKHIRNSPAAKPVWSSQWPVKVIKRDSIKALLKAFLIWEDGNRISFIHCWASILFVFGLRHSYRTE